MKRKLFIGVECRGEKWEFIKFKEAWTGFTKIGTYQRIEHISIFHFPFPFCVGIFSERMLHKINTASVRATDDREEEKHFFFVIVVNCAHTVVDALEPPQATIYLSTFVHFENFLFSNLFQSFSHHFADNKNWNSYW